MEHRMLLYLSGLVFSAACLTAKYDTSLAFERPVTSATAIYFLLGVLLLLADKYRLLDSTAAANGPAPPTKSAYLSIPGDERFIKPLSSPRRSPVHSRRDSGDVFVKTPSPPWRRRIAFAVLVLSLCARVLVFVGWMRRIECSSYYIACFLPFLLAVYEFWSAPDLDLWLEKVDDRLLWNVHVKTRGWLQDHRYTYLLANLAFSICGNIVAEKSSAPASTYICLPNSKGWIVALVFQVLGLVLDAISIICAQELSTLDSFDRQPKRTLRSFAEALLASSGCLTVCGGAVYIAYRSSTGLLDQLSFSYVAEVIELTVILGLTLLCIVLLLPRIGPQQISTIVCFSCVSASSWITAHTVPLAFTRQSEYSLIICIAVMTATFIFAVECWSMASISNQTPNFNLGLGKRIRTVLIGAGMLLLCSRLSCFLWQTTTLASHPIDRLIFKAQQRHALWQRESGWQGTVASAALNYVSRYGRAPPPNFDKWYEFAIKHDSLVIDEFDNIYDDLLLFWSVTPSELRRMTSEEMAQIDNGVGGIKIRNHKAFIHPDVSESHAWMMEAVVNMTAPFIEYLPDMDIPINLNDESRVMVPYSERSTMTDRALSALLQNSTAPPRNAFSHDKVTTWPAIDSGSVEQYWPERPFQSIFESHGSAYCPPDSPSRQVKRWQIQSLCTQCVTPHSDHMGPFPNDMSAARDVCNQPDLAHLHGFYSAPSTFRPTSELRPTFSQSKAPGFLDIRYPSPWNYADLARYAPDQTHPDPAFAEKDTTLFWLGTTTEGFASADGRHAWQGMTRQRFVNAINFPAAQSVLLPTESSGTMSPWQYQHLSGRELRSMLDTDVSIAVPIARCMHNDCSDQIDLFNRTNLFDTSATAHSAISTTGIDFQDHWKYRYLFDMDGAGFSGRFIPFLRSKSLVFKTTGLFSEWWDGRVQEWWHYVPIDIRLTGLYSTLSYFMGVKPGAVKNAVPWTGREDQAELIANNGREWANKVLRKEDMEIYMFRLLLEWGRLVDEERDEIGFMPGAA